MSLWKQIEALVGEPITLDTHKFDSSASSKYANHRYSIHIIGRKNEFGMRIRPAYFDLRQMPGCCGVCVSTGAYVHPIYRGKGLGTLLNQYRQHLAKEMGYTILICTDTTKNAPQRRILEKEGWKDLHTFVNARTGNEVAISLKELK